MDLNDVEASDGIERNEFSDGDPVVEIQDEPEAPQEDSLVVEIGNAERGNAISKEVADFCIEAYKSEDQKKVKKVKMVYKVFKTSNDYEDFTNSLTGLHKRMTK